MAKKPRRKSTKLKGPKGPKKSADVCEQCGTPVDGEPECPYCGYDVKS